MRKDTCLEYFFSYLNDKIGHQGMFLIERMNGKNLTLTFLFTFVFVEINNNTNKLLDFYIPRKIIGIY